MSRERYWTGTIVLVSLVACCWSGCQRKEDREAPPPTAVARTSTQPQPNEIWSAVLGAYFHAYAELSARPLNPGRIEPMSPERIAQVLRGAPSPEWDFARRMAIQILVAAATPPSEVQANWQPTVIAQTLDGIGAPLKELEGHLRRVLCPTSGGQSCRFGDPARVILASNGEGSVDEQQVATTQWLAAQVLDTTTGAWQRRCCACLLEYDVDPSPGYVGGVALGYFNIKVLRQVDDLKKLIDPQTWARCNPFYFSTSHVTAEGDQCPSGGGNTPPCTPTVPGEVSPTPVIGSDWEGVLYEHAVPVPGTGPPCSNGIGSEKGSAFRNLLQICAKNDGDDYRVDYGLCQSIDGSVDCNCGAGSMETDCGFSRVSPYLGDAIGRLVGVKRLKYTDDDLGDWTTVGLRAMIDLIVEVGVCCDLNESGPCLCLSPSHVEDADPTSPLCDGDSCNGGDEG